MRSALTRHLTLGTALCALVIGSVVGCGGGNGGGNGADSGGTASGSRDAVVTLPEFGTIDVYYLTGAGRAEGDITAILQRVSFEDSVGFEKVNVNQKLNLSAYNSSQLVSLNVPFTTRSERIFDTLTWDVSALSIETATGNQSVAGESIGNNPYAFAGLADIHVHRGRRTSVSVFLDPSMYTQDGALWSFDPVRFREVNIPTDGSVDKIAGNFSDFLSFDVSNLAEADRPLMASGGRAGRVFFSGDGYGLGVAGVSGSYEGLTDAFVDDGSAVSPIVIDGLFTAPEFLEGRPLPGTYTLVQSDPTDLTGEAQLIALQGMWYEYTQRISNMNERQMIAFPSSRDGDVQDVVYVEQTLSTNADGTTRARINSMFFGYAEFNWDTGVHRVFLYNLRHLPGGAAGVAPAFTGTLTDLQTSSGTAATTTPDVRRATYSLSGGRTGRLAVFRR